LPEEGQFTGAALVVEGLQKGTMPKDMRVSLPTASRVCFWLTERFVQLVAKEYGTVEFVEVLEETADSFSMIIAYPTKGECDYCLQKLE